MTPPYVPILCLTSFIHSVVIATRSLTACLLCLSAVGVGADQSWSVSVQDAELESDDGPMSRVLQLNVSWTSHDVQLTLTRNDNVPTNVTVLIGADGGRMTSFDNRDVSQVCRQQTHCVMTAFCVIVIWVRGTIHSY